MFFNEKYTRWFTENRRRNVVSLNQLLGRSAKMSVNAIWTHARTNQRHTLASRSQQSLKVCWYRTRTRLGGVREGIVEIKQTKVVYTAFIQSAKTNAKHDFSLFYLDQRHKAAVAFCINKPNRRTALTTQPSQLCDDSGI